MQKGFIFNDILCVDCKACSAACIIENGLTTHAREIFTFNSSAHPSLPVVHLSMACNHCEKPVCLEGCPAGSYSREPVTGGIIADENKCIGCSYCEWNCPYEAPKINLRKGIIEKCNLCYGRLSEGLACAICMPTGALSYSDS
jgi:anaerobic dimethyl sulfoxide reductase subunit B (iron-sulfur subunit)